METGSQGMGVATAHHRFGWRLFGLLLAVALVASLSGVLATRGGGQSSLPVRHAPAAPAASTGNGPTYLEIGNHITRIGGSTESTHRFASTNAANPYRYKPLP